MNICVNILGNGNLLVLGYNDDFDAISDLHDVPSNNYDFQSSAQNRSPLSFSRF